MKVAIIGCGRMGQQHAKSTAALGHQVSMACDIDPERARALAARHSGCEALTDPTAIPWRSVDAAFVCTPPFARGPLEIAAARAGVGLFLEKPIGLSASTGRDMLAATLEAGVVTSVGYMNRYRASVRRARAALQTVAPLGFTAHWFGAAYKVPWWSDPALSGGQINEQCTHVIDLARHLVGEVAEVEAISQPHPSHAGQASVALLLRFERGVLGTITCGCLANEKQIGARVFTSRGQLALEGWDFQLSPAPPHDEFEVLASGDVFLDECAAFLAAVETGDRSGIRCDLEDALRTQGVVDAVRAALSGQGRRRPSALPTLDEEPNHAAVSA